MKKINYCITSWKSKREIIVWPQGVRARSWEVESRGENERSEWGEGTALENFKTISACYPSCPLRIFRYVAGIQWLDFQMCLNGSAEICLRLSSAYVLPVMSPWFPTIYTICKDPLKFWQHQCPRNGHFCGNTNVHKMAPSRFHRDLDD